MVDLFVVTIFFLEILLHGFKLFSLTPKLIDTLLNVFLAIAVDNLANAQVLTRDEENELKQAEEQRRLRSMLFSPKPQESSKWNKVRAVHKMLTFTRQKDKDKNPFKGVTYQGRPHAFLR